MSESVAEQVMDAVRAKLGAAILFESTLRDEAVVTIDRAKWPPLAAWLAKDAGFSFLADLCGVDRLEGDSRFEVVYNLTDMDSKRRLRVRVPVESENPRIPSVTGIWPTANWLEREAYDMFGIVFEGHPGLDRILMPDEWEGHPLRKDYAIGKVPVEYKHISPGF